MDKLVTTLKFLGWPIACGVLFALVVLQYQQLQRLSLMEIAAPAVSSVSPPSNPYVDAIAKAAPSVVSINATRINVESIERAAQDKFNLRLEESASLGSGVIIDARGFVLTNLHVVDTLFDVFDTEVTLKDGRRKPATVVAWDKSSDLAILHINMDNLTPISVGEDHLVEVGDIVFAIGYPRNIGQSVSQGIVSAFSRDKDQNVYIIQTDAAVNPGNSGGALIDIDGNLIGINSSIFSESGNFEGIGFATPVSLAINASVGMIQEAIETNSGYLGVLTGEALDAQSSQLFFGVDNIRGMLVENVDNGGSAQRAGILPGDVITRVETTAVIDGQNIMMEIRNKKPGDTIAIEVFRQGQTLILPTTLGFGQAIVIEQ
ncbi:MAG: serine protease DegS [Pseudohongiellaceae bacterium]|jgi:serine protease DegS